jgi:hypothetical protein
MATKTQGNGWDRADLNLRLSKRRRDLLTRLAAGLDPNATPTDAIDRAIALGLQATMRAENDARLDDIVGSIENSAREQRVELRSMRDDLRRLETAVDQLRDLISADPNSVDGIEDGPLEVDVLLFRNWLARELLSRKTSARQEATVRLVWSSTSRKDRGALAVDFDAALISVDGKPAGIAVVGMARARFEVNVASPLASAWGRGPFLLRCVPFPNGWKLQARLIKSDGGAGELAFQIEV